MDDIKALEKKNTTINFFCRLIYIFVICALVGWLWEEAYCYVKHGFWVERGFLFGPWLPIYGLGGMLVYIMREKLVKNPVSLFFSSVLVAGFIEYVGHWLLEAIFDKKWWDYSREKFNINGRIELIRLVFFGLAACIAVYLMIPPFLKLINRGNKYIMSTVAYILFSLLMADVITSGILHFIG